MAELTLYLSDLPFANFANPHRCWAEFLSLGHATTLSIRRTPHYMRNNAWTDEGYPAGIHRVAGAVWLTLMGDQKV